MCCIMYMFQFICIHYLMTVYALIHMYTLYLDMYILLFDQSFLPLGYGWTLCQSWRPVRLGPQ